MFMDSISLVVTFVALFAIEQTYCQENFKEKKRESKLFIFRLKKCEAYNAKETTQILLTAFNLNE